MCSSDLDATERFKMLFPFYPFNSRLLKLLADTRAEDRTDKKGFVPYEGCQAIIPENLPQDKHDKLKYEYLQKLITTCKHQQIQTITQREKSNTVQMEIRASLEQALLDVKVVEKIGVLSSSIMDITNQTNLLALNASIEAVVVY